MRNAFSATYSDGIFRLPLKIFAGDGLIQNIIFLNTSIFERMTEVGIERDVY